MEEAWLFVQEAKTLMDNVGNAVAPAVRVAGMRLWQGLALIVVSWTGLQMALGGTLDMGRVVRMALGLSIPLAMLQFYVVDLPGTGRNVPDLITGMGAWVNQMVVADTGQTMAQRMGLAFDAFAARLGEAGFFGGEGMGWMATIANLPALMNAAFDLVVTIGLMTMLAIALVLVWSLGQAQVLWAYLAMSITLLLGPIFIPWIVVPQLSFLFWGWFRTLLIYSLYGAVASTVFRIIAELGITVVDAWTTDITNPNATWTGLDGLTAAGIRTAVTVPYIIAAGLASAKVGELTQLLVLGGGNPGSNAGQAARAVQMVRGSR